MSVDTCYRCGNHRRVAKKDGGHPVCPSCYQKYYQPHFECFICGKSRRVAGWYEYRPMCAPCYEKLKRPIEKCYMCGNDGTISKIDDTGNICKKCYEKFDVGPKDVCLECGVMSIVKFRTSNQGAVCESCYSKFYRAYKVCSFCGKNKLVNWSSGSVISCSVCYRKYIQEERKCSICGRRRKIVQILGDKDICFDCYISPLSICCKCGESRPIKKHTISGPLCSSCYTVERYKIDMEFGIVRRLRQRVRAALKLYSDTGKIKAADKYGIDYPSIVKHLGLPPGDGYHIDHIIPLSAFDMNNEEHIKAAFSPENHRWLLEHENLTKGCKFRPCDFENYISSRIP